MECAGMFTYLSVLWVALTTYAGKRNQNIIAWVKRYEEAHNHYDVPAVMAMFAENASFELTGQGTLSDLVAIRGIHEYDKAIRAQTAFHDCVVEDLTVTCAVTEQNAWLTAVGVDEIFYPTATFTFSESGQIKKIVASISAADGQLLGEILADFVPWLHAERPGAAAVLFSTDGQFIYSANNGVLVLDLLGQWRDEKQEV